MKNYSLFKDLELRFKSNAIYFCKINIISLYKKVLLVLLKLFKILIGYKLL